MNNDRQGGASPQSPTQEGADKRKAHYRVVPRKAAFLFAAARSIETGKAVNVADNSVQEFIDCALELGADPVEAPPEHESMTSTRNDDIRAQLLASQERERGLRTTLDALNREVAYDAPYFLHLVAIDIENAGGAGSAKRIRKIADALGEVRPDRLATPGGQP